MHATRIKKLIFIYKSTGSGSLIAFSVLREDVLALPQPQAAIPTAAATASEFLPFLNQLQGIPQSHAKHVLLHAGLRLGQASSTQQVFQWAQLLGKLPSFLCLVLFKRDYLFL